MTTLRRSLARRLERAVGPTALGRTIVAQSDARRAAEESRLVTEASQAWARKDRVASLDALRAAVLVRGGTAAIWRTYAQRLVECRRPDAAWEAILASLACDPTNVDTLELYIELVYQRDRSFRGVKHAVRGAAAGLESRPAAHLDMLDLILPFGIEDGLDAIVGGPDPVARAVVALHRADGDESVLDDVGLTTDQRNEAVARFALARGRISLAVRSLEQLPDGQLPVGAIRRAIRRIVKRPNPSGARHLLRQYGRVRPGDAWAAARSREVAAYVAGTDAHRALTELATSGFPLSDPAPARDTGTSRTGLYLLHNSLPFTSAGYATRTHGLLQALQDREWRMVGVTRPGFPYDLSKSHVEHPIAPTDDIDGVQYVRLSTTHEEPSKTPLTGYVDDYVRRLTPWVEAERPFVVHAASNHWNGLAAVEAGRRLGLPSVYEVRGLWEVTRLSREPDFAETAQYRYMARMEADAARSATRVFAITAALKEELERRGVDGDRITLLPNGVDTQRFVPRPRDEQLADELGVTGKTVIGYVGSVLDYEGIDLLVEATAMLKARRQDFHVLVVGDGAAWDSVRRLASDLRVDDVLTFTGRVPHEEVERYYSVVDIAPLPRLPLPVCEMVSPLKPFEAMAMGKVVVAADVAALAEIVQDGRTGLLHRKGDAASLAERLETLISQPDLLRRMGESSREWVVRERDWTSIAGVISDVYDELRAGARG